MREMLLAAGYAAIFISIGMTVCGFAFCTWAGVQDWDTSEDDYDRR